MTDLETEFVILHALRVKGLASEQHLVDVTGIPLAVLVPTLEMLAARSSVKQRAGRMPGYMLTSQGSDEHAHLLPDKVSDAERSAVQGAYAVFLEVNGKFKELCTRWQVRPDAAGVSQPNDHADPDHDAAVLADLEEVHAKIVAGLAVAAESCSRLQRYTPRLGNALARIHEGDTGALTRPLSDSYHDVWMELHQDFLLTLGREREAADGH